MASLFEEEIERQDFPVAIKTQIMELVADGTFENYANETFSAVDTDGNGTLDRSELVTSLGALYEQFPAGFLPDNYQNTLQAESDKLFDKFDKNKDGKLDRKEYYEFGKYVLTQLFLSALIVELESQ